MNFSKKIGLTLLVVGLLPILNGALFFHIVSRIYLKDLALSHLTGIAKILTSHVKEFISSGFESLNILIQNPVIFSPKTSLEEKIKEIEKIKNYYPKFQDISIIDAKGNTLYSSSLKFSGEWKYNAWFREAREKKEIVMSDIYALFSPREPLLAFFVPLLNEKNEISFILGVQLNMEKFLDIFDALKERAILINSRGRILAFSQRDFLFEKISSEYPLKESFEKQQGKVEFNFNGKRVVGVYHIINMGEVLNLKQPDRWQLIVFQPREEILKLGEILRNQIVIGSTILLFFILLLSWILTNQIVSPIRKLILATKQIAQGNFENPIEIQRKDEFGELIVSFNTMIEEIRKSREFLEKERDILEMKVKERTKELEELMQKQEEIIKERTKELREKIEELENFRKIAVGRELKMIELKEEIEKLKEELKKFQKS